ncbi:hypothetical protein BC629DRAFT_999971 [Irpex lacteus]|nr:hypothetical protein BC629DRAFT_999971 [Irpex lacteus]
MNVRVLLQQRRNVDVPCSIAHVRHIVYLSIPNPPEIRAILTIIPALLRGSLELHTRAQLGSSSSHSQMSTNEFEPSRTVDSTEQAIWILGSLGLGPSPSWRQMSGPSGHGCHLGQRELLAIKPDTPIPTYPVTSKYSSSARLLPQPFLQRGSVDLHCIYTRPSPPQRSSFLDSPRPLIHLFVP